MRIRVLRMAIALVLALALVVPVLAGQVEPRRYFGPGVGYPDYGSSKYFYNYYPPEKWGTYGYGTGHMGMGYGPYIYGGRKLPPSAEDQANYGLATIRPKLKWIGGNQVLVSAPAGVKQITVDVLSFSGAVLETGTVVSPPFQIIARLPEGATSIRVRLDLPDSGFSAMAFSIQPVG